MSELSYNKIKQFPEFDKVYASTEGEPDDYNFSWSCSLKIEENRFIIYSNGTIRSEFRWMSLETVHRLNKILEECQC